VWAGDSRIYRLRHGRLTQLTTDHTWASELNLQTPDEEADHAITRAVGGEDTLLLDVRRDRVRLGDRYLLCSDGLTREVKDAQIAELMAGESVQQCASALIDAALQAGARDNVTVVVIEAQ
jgi:serine/threonine protein phosphatase PrpC